MKRIALFLFLSLEINGSSLFAQSGHIKLDNIASDERSKKLQALIAVYRYTGQPFEDPVLNGIDTKEKPHTFTAKLPDLMGARDTSYAFMYFGGIKQNENLSGYVFMVIVNNTRNEKPCLLWIDRNYNLDLTDDGSPDTFFFNTKYKDISFSNPYDKAAFYTLRISRFPFNYNTKYLAMLDEYYKENSGSKKYSGSFFSFREERLNIRSGDCIIGRDSFRVGLKDTDCDGIYNEPGVDVILLGDFGNPVLSDNYIAISSKHGGTYFEKNGRHYDVNNIEASGGSVDISLDSGAKIKNSLVVGKKMKKFRFMTTDKDKKSISIRKFRKKPTFVYIWRFAEPGFLDDTAALREIQLKYSDKVNLVTLNYGETPKELKLFKNRNRINWLIGFSTASINQKLFIENYPTGILTKKRLRISRVGISAKELLSLLNSNSL